MMPTIGRIIHVYEPLNDQCLGAIVTANDYGRGVVPTVYCTVFSPHGSSTDAARRMVLPDQGTWHDPRDCHQDVPRDPANDPIWADLPEHGGG